MQLCKRTFSALCLQYNWLWLQRSITGVITYWLLPMKVRAAPPSPKVVADHFSHALPIERSKYGEGTAMARMNPVISDLRGDAAKRSPKGELPSRRTLVEFSWSESVEGDLNALRHIASKLPCKCRFILRELVHAMTAGRQKLEAPVQVGIAKSMGIGEGGRSTMGKSAQCLRKCSFAKEIRQDSVGGGLNLFVTSLASGMSGRDSSYRHSVLFVYWNIFKSCIDLILFNEGCNH